MKFKLDFLKKNKKSLIKVFLPAALLSVICGALYTGALGGRGFSGRIFYSPDSLIRMLLFFILFAFVGICAVFDRKKIFDFIFKNRWYFALGAFVLLVALNINFSSVAMYTRYVQPDCISDSTMPIFGYARDIRSDEWLVNVPFAFTSDFEGFGEFNHLVRAAENYSISVNGLKLGWSALSSPMSWGYYIFGAERGLSFFWSFILIMSFMSAYELSLIISKGSRRLALFGGAFIGLSQFSMWWSVCQQVAAAQMLIVCAYCFFGEVRLGRKILYAAGAAFSAAVFITKLYPAWQVPLGYLLIGLIVWLVLARRREIARLSRCDLLIIITAFAFMVSVVLAYLLDSTEANKAVLETVYPGKRFDTGGGGALKAGTFLHTLMSPFRAVAVEGTNTSESAMYFCLFPLPIIFSAYSFVRQLIRKRQDKDAKIDIFNLAVLLPALFLTAYISTGFPEWLAKYSLLSYSTGDRAADFVGLACLYLLIRSLANAEERVSLAVFAPAAVLCAAFWIYASSQKVAGYMPVLYCIFALLFALGIAYVAYCKPPERISAPAITAAAVTAAVLGLCVHPVMHGADALTEKPLSHAVRAEAQSSPEAKWIGYGESLVGQFLIANGAPAVNSVNYIPNLEFWHRFDPSGEAEHAYNRYAHIKILFTDAETQIELLRADCVQLTLNFGDIEKTGAEYAVSVNGEIDFGQGAQELLSKYNIEFKLIYSYNNSVIYKIIYHE